MARQARNAKGRWRAKACKGQLGQRADKGQQGPGPAKYRPGGQGLARPGKAWLIRPSEGRQGG